MRVALPMEFLILGGFYWMPKCKMKNAAFCISSIMIIFYFAAFETIFGWTPLYSAEWQTFGETYKMFDIFEFRFDFASFHRKRK